MRILVTAGNTATMIDRVRCITNVFSGRTGAYIAVEAARRGHAVQVLTSKPEALTEAVEDENITAHSITLKPYLTFVELQNLLEERLTTEHFDAVIHCAAVSDYECSGVFAPDSDSSFDPASGQWSGSGTKPPTLIDRNAAKVSSAAPELWFRMKPTVKLVDRIREPWGFRGVLVKFKLEVDISEVELLERAEKSRQQSSADLMVANSLEGMSERAFLGPLAGRYEPVVRDQLARRLLDEVERLGAARTEA